jgi:hypothetical protein
LQIATLKYLVSMHMEVQSCKCGGRPEARKESSHMPTPCIALLVRRWDYEEAIFILLL